MSNNELFEEIIRDRSDGIKVIARAVRAKFRKIYPDVDETIWVKQKTSGYGIGPKKMSQHFGWIVISKKHVSMGFNFGSSLSDPDHLLEGTGKNMRHIKIRQLSDLNNKAIDEMVIAAVLDRKSNNSGDKI